MPNEITEERIDDLICDNYNLRRLLWIYHGHYHGHQVYLYGDDGEMQCNKCMIDFKRDSIKTIRERLVNVI